MFKKNNNKPEKDIVADKHPRIKVLIADDEAEVHTITKIVLANFQFENMRVEFLSAYSGSEAIETMRQNPDIAVILLDVVMEEDDSGLNVAAAIRKELDNPFVRIILRTGQPGQAPKEKVIVDYDINDYREKTELDNKTMFCMMYSAIRSYNDIMKIELARIDSERYRKGLENILEASSDLFQQRNLKQLAGGLLQEMSVLLQASDDALLIKSDKRLCREGGSSNIEVMAASGAYEQFLSATDIQVLPEQIYSHLQQSCESKKSFIIDKHYVGYFTNKNSDIHLLYLGEIKNLDTFDQTLVDIYTNNVDIAFDNLLLEQEIIQTQSELILKLGNVVESRSEETANHVNRVAHISKMLARACQLEEFEIDIIFNASPLHDVGKIAIPDTILLKPGKLDAREWKIMQTHAQIGADILGSSDRPLINAASVIAKQHHEKYNGTGYPAGLKGEQIHIYSRIVALADVYDALTNNRPYKPGWTHDEAIQYINDHSGSQFDPALVKLMIENTSALKQIQADFKD